jgi:hypothetical protein
VSPERKTVFAAAAASFEPSAFETFRMLFDQLHAIGFIGGESSATLAARLTAAPNVKVREAELPGNAHCDGESPGAQDCQ